jgi:hypothetical protein
MTDEITLLKSRIARLENVINDALNCYDIDVDWNEMSKALNESQPVSKNKIIADGCQKMADALGIDTDPDAIRYIAKLREGEDG